MPPDYIHETALPARLAIAAAAATLLLLAGLHVLSPELDPSWRMVSEYANGRYGWVLSLMFVSWALSSWALAFAMWSHVKTAAGKADCFFLPLQVLARRWLRCLTSSIHCTAWRR